MAERLDRTRLRRVAPVVCWSAVVVAASVAPASGGVAEGPSAARGILSVAASAPGPFGVGVDKWLHLGAYWVVAFLAAVAFRRRGRERMRRTLALAVAFGIALGGGVELVQATLPTRAFDPADAAVNGVGAVLGAATYLLRRRATNAEGDGE